MSTVSLPPPTAHDCIAVMVRPAPLHKERDSLWPVATLLLILLQVVSVHTLKLDHQLLWDPVDWASGRRHLHAL